jgi:DNA-binding FadR family transcriptional regulator
VNAIGQAIVGGMFPPGTVLPREADLMAEFGVSRTSLREAVKVLAAKGLVETRQKVGTRVRPREEWNVFDTELLAWHHAQGMDESILKDLIELRQTLEPTAAQLAAGRATMSDLARIEQSLRAMREHTDAAGYAAADVQFHLAVYAASHNALLTRFGHLVADFLQTSFAVQQAAAEQHGFDLDVDVRMHHDVYDAVNRGAAAEASDAMLGVVLTGKAALASALENGGQSFRVR